MCVSKRDVDGQGKDIQRKEGSGRMQFSYNHNSQFTFDIHDSNKDRRAFELH